MNRLKTFRVLIPMIGCSLLFGCATDVKQCDPNLEDPSLITKFNCQYSGTYQKRIDERKVTLANESKLNEEFKSVLKALEQEILTQNQQIASGNQMNEKLKSDLMGLLSSIKSKTGEDAALQARISQLQQDVNNESEQASVIEKQLQLQELQSKLQQLEDDLGLN